MTTRSILVLGISFAALASVIACDDDDSSSSSSSGGASSSAFRQCPGQGGGSSSCTEAESKPYTDCLMQQCDAKYQECFGANYKSGDFTGGACATWFSCTNKCECNDTSCRSSCGIPDNACLQCTLGTQDCSSKCQAPACASASASSSSGGSSSGSTSGGAGCTGLRACCAKMTNEPLKNACNTQANNGTDPQCSQALSSYESASLCK
jgi:hypothetical protein